MQKLHKRKGIIVFIVAILFLGINLNLPVLADNHIYNLPVEPKGVRQGEWKGENDKDAEKLRPKKFFDFFRFFRRGDREREEGRGKTRVKNKGYIDREVYKTTEYQYEYKEADNSKEKNRKRYVFEKLRGLEEKLWKRMVKKRSEIKTRLERLEKEREEKRERFKERIEVLEEKKQKIVERVSGKIERLNERRVGVLKEMIERFRKLIAKIEVVLLELEEKGIDVEEARDNLEKVKDRLEQLYLKVEEQGYKAYIVEVEDITEIGIKVKEVYRQLLSDLKALKEELIEIRKDLKEVLEKIRKDYKKASNENANENNSASQ